MFAAAGGSLYHVGYQYDSVLIENMEGETITCMSLVNGNRLYVGTDARLYSYFIQIGNQTRETSRINDFEEIKGVLTKDVSAIIGTLDINGRVIVYTDKLVYDITDREGKQYVEEAGKIIKVVRAGNLIVVARKDGLRALDASLGESQSLKFGKIDGDDIVDVTSTNNLVIALTKSGRVYKYQIARDDSILESSPQQLDLNNKKVSSIASYGNMLAVILENSNQITYFKENSLPVLIENSATNVNKIRYGDGQELVYASLKDGLALSSERIGENNQGNPVILESGTVSYDSLVLDGVIYNCTDNGIYGHELVTDEDGKTIGASENATHWLAGQRINGLIEYYGTPVAGGEGGIFALSSTVSASVYEGVDVDDYSFDFTDIAFFNGKRCFIFKDEDDIWLQEENSTITSSFRIENNFKIRAAC